jgi:hypothetical protein
MTENFDPSELAGLKELLIANSIQVEALTQLLFERGIITESEFFTKRTEIYAEYQRSQND